MNAIPVLNIEETRQVHISLYESQIRYLQTIHENINTAIKILIGREQKVKLQNEMNITLIVFSIGLLLLFFASVSNNEIYYLIFMLVGFIYTIYSIFSMYAIYKKWRKQRWTNP